MVATLLRWEREPDVCALRGDRMDGLWDCKGNLQRGRAIRSKELNVGMMYGYLEESLPCGQCNILDGAHLDHATEVRIVKISSSYRKAVLRPWKIGSDVALHCVELDVLWQLHGWAQFVQEKSLNEKHGGDACPSESAVKPIPGRGLEMTKWSDAEGMQSRNRSILEPPVNSSENDQVSWSKVFLH